MTIAAINGEFGIAPQAAKVGAGAFTPGSYTWRRFRVPTMDAGAIQLQSPFPQEISGFMTPTGWYKGGVFFGGTFDILPRVQSVMGFLFYALMGDVSTVANRDLDHASVTGLYKHYFRHNALNTIPWMAVRTKIPGQVAADALATYGVDCKVNAIQLRLAAAGKLTARLGIVGRRAQWEENPSFTWNNNLEDDTTVPEACTGSVELGADAPAVIAFQADIVNTLTSPQQEMIFGSYNPDDFVPLARAMNLTITTKWANPDLYQKVMTGAAGGVTWDPNPYYTEGLTTGDYGFRLKINAPKPISGSSPATNYGMSIECNRVVWMPRGNPRMAAGDMVTQDFTATVTLPTINSEDYMRIILVNDTASYAWS